MNRPGGPLKIGNPLEFIYRDHMREREVCALLDRIAAAPHPDAADIAEVSDFLNVALPLHLRDEEEDLFPLVMRRCEPEDEIDAVIARLESDHGHAVADTPKVVAALRQLETAGGPGSADTRDLLVSYAAHSRRHLILENAIILPFAKLRLTGRDLEKLARNMRARRGMPEVPDA